MKKDLQSPERIMIQMIIIAIILGIIGSFIVQEPLEYVKGVAFGTIFSILKFRLMEITIRKSIQMPQTKAHNYALRNYMIRYILTGVVLLVAAMQPGIHLVGTVIGLLTLKMSVFLSLGMDKININKF
jgi:hypothetical protein